MTTIDMLLLHSHPWLQEYIRDAERWRELLRQHKSDEHRTLSIAKWDSALPCRYTSIGTSDPAALLDSEIAKRKTSDQTPRNIRQ